MSSLTKNYDSAQMHEETHDTTYVMLPPEIPLHNDTAVIEYICENIHTFEQKRKLQPYTGFVTLEQNSKHRFFKWQPVENGSRQFDPFYHEIARQTFLNDLMTNPLYSENAIHDSKKNKSHPEINALLRTFFEKKLDLDSIPVRVARLQHHWQRTVDDHEIIFIELDYIPSVEFSEDHIQTLIEGLTFLSRIQIRDDKKQALLQQEAGNSEVGPFPIHTDKYYRKNFKHWSRKIATFIERYQINFDLEPLNKLLDSTHLEFTPHLTHTDPALHNVTFMQNQIRDQLVLYDLEDMVFGSRLEDIARLLNTISTNTPHLFDQFIEELKAAKEYLPEQDYKTLRFFRVYKELFLFDFFSERAPGKASSKLDYIQQLLDSSDPFIQLH